MMQISKEQSVYLKKRFPDAFITVCSKRKHGAKGYRQSGKTYYCPEVNEYIKALRELSKNGG